MRAADLRWLLLAVVLHALVLSIPLNDLAPKVTSTPAQVVVRLITGMTQTEPGESPVQEPVEAYAAPAVIEVAGSKSTPLWAISITPST